MTKKSGGAKKDRPLTAQQETFCTAIAQGMNQSDAYRHAYPKSRKWVGNSVWNRASLLMNNEKVRARIADLARSAGEANGITVERTLREVARLAYLDPRKLFNPDGTPKPIHELDDDTAAAIGGLEVVETVTEDGGKTARVSRYKLTNKEASLEKLMRHLGQYERDNNQIGDGLAARLLAGRKRIKAD